ncbi:MAG: gamma-glutamyl-gamma-aminobutyrate hydrolase family protein [Bdellovibrionota bacterium]
MSFKSPARFSLIFIAVLAFAIECFAGSLAVWQPTTGAVPLVIYRADGESAIDSAKRYLKHFNASEELVEISEKKLEIPLTGFSDLVRQTDNPLMLVSTSEPQQFRGSKNGKSWFKQLSDLGSEVYVLPVVHDLGLTKAQAAEYRDLLTQTFDGVLALGGADVDPSLYGDKNRQAEGTLKFRDVSELKLIKSFLEMKNNAVFGICRGAQLTAVALGYKLHQDIGIETSNSHYHIANDHPITWVESAKSILKNALASFTSDFPSQHHQAIIAESNSDGELVLVAKHQPTPDVTPISEAFEFKNRIGFLTQWHPERDKTEKGFVVMNLMVQQARNAMLLRASEARFTDSLSLAPNSKSCNRVVGE